MLTNLVCFLLGVVVTAASVYYGLCIANWFNPAKKQQERHECGCVKKTM